MKNHLLHTPHMQTNKTTPKSHYHRQIRTHTHTFISNANTNHTAMMFQLAVCVRCWLAGWLTATFRLIYDGTLCCCAGTIAPFARHKIYFNAYFSHPPHTQLPFRGVISNKIRVIFCTIATIKHERAREYMRACKHHQR